MFEFPSHFKYPQDSRIFFLDHIQVWEYFLSDLKNKSNKILEIGALYGGSTIYMLESFCKNDDSEMHIMDINTNEFLLSNIEPYSNVKLHIGESSHTFKSMNKNYFDLIYIDGNHTSKYVLEDAVNSFYSLKIDGIMIFDDYGGGLEQPRHMRVNTAVDSFVYCYEKYLKVIHVGYQVFLQKINYFSIEEMQENYYN